VTPEARLRATFDAIRGQAHAPADGADRLRAALGGTPVRRRPPARLALAGLAAAAALIAAVVLVGRDRDEGDPVATDVDTLDHAAWIERAEAECREFQAAVPPGRYPDFLFDPDGTRAWADAYALAVSGTFDVFADLLPEEEDDRAATEFARAAMQGAVASVDEAHDLMDAGDGATAMGELERALQFVDQVSFRLAQSGAVACDPRGVTQPTS
jgi:hypothetical protein